MSGTVYWSYPILHFGIVACTFFPTTFLEIAVHERVVISLVEVYERMGKSVIWVCQRAKRLIDEWYGFENWGKRSVFKVACSQTLYFLFKVRRARVIKCNQEREVQRLYYSNISAGHTSILQVYRWYWTYVGITIFIYRWRMCNNNCLKGRGGNDDDTT